MKFAIATVAFWEALGYDTANWRKSNDGNQAITELKYAEILGINLAENPEVKIYFGDSPELLGLLESAAWHRDGTNGPFDSYNLLEQLAEVDTRLTTAVAEVIDGEAERVAAEDAREVTYNALVADVQANVDAFDVALEDGIVAENLAVKLAEKEATYAPRLTAAEQQLEQSVAMQSGLLAFKGSDTTANINAKTGMVTGDYWWSTDGLTYLAYTGTAWSNVGSSLTELSNVRLGADGVTYATAGEAVRGQFVSAKSDVNNLRDHSFNLYESFTLTNKQGTVFIPANIVAGKTYEFKNITGVGIQVFTTSKESGSTDYRVETVMNWHAVVGTFQWTATINAPYLMFFFSAANGSASVKRLNTVVELIEANLDTIEADIVGVKANIDNRLNGLELTQKLGYIDTGGVLRPAASGTNKYVEINNVKPNTVIVFSGAYSSASWGLVFGYYANGTIVPLLAGKSGGYTNEIITITDANIITVRAWSDTALKALSCRYYTFKDVLETLTVLGADTNNFANDPHIITVDIDGAGDFTDINAAITYAKANFDVVNVPITIFIKNGTYVIPHYGYWPWAAIDVRSNRISLVGESWDGVKLKITNTATLQNRLIDFSGEAIIANMSIYCLNDGTYTTANDLGHNCYGVHNDTDFASDVEYKTILDNVYIYSECHAPIGGGLKNNQKQVYRNVETVANGIYGSGFYVHAPTTAEHLNCSIVLDNVTAITKNGNKAIDMADVAGSLSYTAIPTTIRRSIFVTNGATKGSEGFKTSHLLTSDSALNNIADLNY